VNNYSKISFDFGPTLLSWLRIHAPQVYESVLEADKLSQSYFSGHGAAMAQVYNHMIMPLANTRDKYTQVIWGIRDFEFHFKRRPEGMWLAETAVDIETLDILAEHEIKFTVLAPGQAQRVRRIGVDDWTQVEPDKIDTTQPYLCRLPSGRTINLFFYNGPVAMDVAQGRILQNGETFAKRLLDIPGNADQPAALSHIATDGETYGHHFPQTDMALAYCLHSIEDNNLAKVTIYPEHLEKYPPDFEVEIKENTAWSCEHGVERWRSDCGCNSGRFPAGSQQWRAPLREGLNWLRDKLAVIYEDRIKQYADPWQLRNEYISVVNDRSSDNVDSFFDTFVKSASSYEQKVQVLKLLEMQRNAMLMFTSCGWFFDDISGIESVQIMAYAARAIQLAKEIDGRDFEPEFVQILEKAQVNAMQWANGKEIYEQLVKPSNIDLNHVGAHLAMSSLFDEYPDKTDIYCYAADIDSYDRTEAGVQSLATGRAAIKSKIVLEKHYIDFAVVHFGEHNLVCSVNTKMSDEDFGTMKEKLKSAFLKGDTTEVMQILNRAFKGQNYSLWHLFKDEQRNILDDLLETTWQDIDDSFRHIYEHNYTIMQIMRSMNTPLPKGLSTAAEYVINEDLCEAIERDKPDLGRLGKLVDEARQLSVKLDEPMLAYCASNTINNLVEQLQDSPLDMDLLGRINTTLEILLKIIGQIDMQNAQNVLFGLSRSIYPDMTSKADEGDTGAVQWVEGFNKLANNLGVVVQ
jgi:hypothetical protein